MHKLTALTLATLLAMSAGQAMAADKSDVTVSGSIVPAGCVPTISKGATFDYGKIKASSLPKDNYNLLPRNSLNLTVRCSAPMKVAFSGVDGRADTVVAPVGLSLITGNITADDKSLFGLGATPGGKKIGAYKMVIYTNANDGFTVDGVKQSATPIKSTDGGQTWSTYGCTNCLWVTPQTAGMLSSFAASGTTTPLAFTTFSTQIQIQAGLNKGSELDLTQVTNLDGQMALQMTYL